METSRRHIKYAFVLVGERKQTEPDRYYFCEKHNDMVKLDVCKQCEHHGVIFSGNVSCTYFTPEEKTMLDKIAASA